MSSLLDLLVVPDDVLADRRYEIRGEISQLKRLDEALKAERNSIDQEFTRRFKERGSTGARTANSTITLNVEDHYPEVYDRQEFETYVLHTGKLHLIQKRVAMGSLQEEIMVLEEEVTIWRTRYKEAKTDVEQQEVARKIMQELLEIPSDSIDEKLTILVLTKQLDQYIENALKEHASIPGINLVQKETINQVKR